ncbi:hypothetical protein ACLMJK_006846 [Lecanora helva]
MISNFSVCCLAIIVTYAQCQPVAKLWDTRIKGKCWKPGVQSDIAMFVGTCIPTLRPLFLIVAKRPGASLYKRSDPYQPSSDRPPGSNRAGQACALDNYDEDSTTAIRYLSADEGWLEAGDDHQNGVTKGGIRRTIELDVVSRTKNNSHEHETYSQAAVGGTRV